MRLLLFTALFFVNVITSIAQKERVVQKPAPVKSLLWEISGNGIKQPSYLFGTMHIICRDDALLSKAMEKIIANSSAIYLELDMDNMMELLGIFQYMNMKGGKKLGDYLTAEEVKRVKDWFVKNQPLIPAMMIEKMKPIFLSSMVGEKGFNCQQPDGMEMRIMEEANKHGKEIKGLETMAYQAGIMDSIPYEIQAKELIKSIDSGDVQDSSVKMLIDLYKQQDIDKLDTMMNKTEGEMSKYNEFLLYRRNRNWADKINTLIKSNSYLFAVGAGHLPGNKGVIALLRKLGYTVKPVENKWAAPSNEM
ncbi:MAG: TraB/GumN family protein [Sphingobacteriales bacterium]|nr:TraB/GumN family protein [Sphingobacteriales bacterium]MBI3717908.1 TraB/GumN family protein [Sphingobacteriales bacterium]